MSKLTHLAVVLSLVSAPAAAQIVIQDAPVAPVTAPAKAPNTKSDLDQLQCRSQDTLGSRLERHQVCMTKEQWFAYEQEHKQRVHEWQIIGLQSH